MAQGAGRGLSLQPPSPSCWDVWAPRLHNQFDSPWPMASVISLQDQGLQVVVVAEMSTQEDGPGYQDPRNQIHSATCWKSLAALASGTWSSAFLTFGEVFEPIGRSPLRFLVLLYMPGKLGGDVGDKVAARPEAVVVSSHPELAVLRASKGYVCQGRQ